MIIVGVFGFWICSVLLSLGQYSGHFCVVAHEFDVALGLFFILSPPGPVRVLDSCIDGAEAVCVISP